MAGVLESTESRDAVGFPQIKLAGFVSTRSKTSLKESDTFNEDAF